MLRALPANLMGAFFLGIGMPISLFAINSNNTAELEISERNKIVDVLRSVVEKELKKPVIIKIETLNVQNGWAFLIGIPLEKSGEPMNYHGTPYQELINAGVFDNWICALLHKEGYNSSNWGVVRHVIGATDMPFLDWEKLYFAPPEIFKLQDAN